MIITPLLMAQALQIGSKFASEVVEDPKLKKRLAMLSGGLGAGLQLAPLAGAFASPKIGSELSKSTVEGLSKSDGSVLSRIVGMGKGGDLTRDLTQPGLFNSMQIGKSGILNSADEAIPTLTNPWDLLSIGM